MKRITIAVKMFGQKKTRKFRLSQRAKVADLLKQLGYVSSVVAVRRNGKIVVEEERLASGDSVEVIPIVTGG